jgi:hypothetical protein
VANQKVIANAVASMTPAAVETKLDRLMIFRSFFILKWGSITRLIHTFYEIPSQQASNIFKNFMESLKFDFKAGKEALRRGRPERPSGLEKSISSG